MSGMDWLRWHHGSVTDPKFQLIAKKSGATVAEVIAFWVFVLESASMANDRGNPGDLDIEAIECLLGLREGKCGMIYSAMKSRGIIEDDGCITSWSKRQPKRERDDDSQERTAAYRKRQKYEKKTISAQVDNVENVTPCDAINNHVTPCNTKNALEESRVDKIESITPFAAHDKIVFDGSRFQNINGQIEIWKRAYPAIDVELEISKAAAWLVANPKNKKSQYSRFLNAWMSRSQDKAPRVHSSVNPIFAGALGYEH